MGYVPAIFVVIGACFLWGIVNYSSLNSRRKSILDFLGLIKEKVAERNRIIQAILNEATPTQLGGLDLHYFEEVNTIEYSETSRFYKKELEVNEWVKKLITQLTHVEYDSTTISMLSSAQEEVAVPIGAYYKVTREFNTLLKSVPSSYMGKWLGYKEVAI